MAKKKVTKKTKATKKTSKKVAKKAVVKKKVAKKKVATKKVAKKAAAKSKAMSKKVAKKAMSKPQKLENAKVSKKIEREKAEKVKELAAKATKNKDLANRVSLNKVTIPPFITSKEQVLAEAKKDKLVAKWYKLYRKAEKLDLIEYNMRHKYEEKTAISHKTLGWGYIVSNIHDRLEVLFEDGVKFLISNYK